MTWDVMAGVTLPMWRCERGEYEGTPYGDGTTVTLCVSPRDVARDTSYDFVCKTVKRR